MSQAAATNAELHTASDPLRGLDPELRSIVLNELRPDEQPVWFTIPRRGRASRWLWLISPFGMLFVLVGIALSATGIAALIGLPFIAIGGFFALFPLIIGRAIRRTVYVLTDQRVITFVGQPFVRHVVTSFRPDELRSIERRENPDGTGSLIFRRDVLSDEDRTVIHRGLLDVDDVAAAERLISEVLLSPQEPTSATP